MSESTYFAAQESKKTASDLLRRANDWYQGLYSNNYFDTIQRSYLAYHGMFGGQDGHKITFGGEQGELTNIDVNHYANIAQHMHVMITANKPAFVAKATNSDNKSIIQSKLASSLLEYYMRDKNLEKYLSKAVEYALILGSGYIKMEWNATRGEVYEVDQETGAPIHAGDVEFKNLTPFNIMFDTSRTSEEHDWVLCRTFKNKHDLAAKYPDLADKIKALSPASEYFSAGMDMFSSTKSDDVPVYEFIHNKTEALPEGRYLLFLDNDIVLIDQANPYPELPVFRIAARDVMGTSFGYSPMFALLPVQDALNATYSAILSNQSAFAVQSIFVKEGSNIKPKSLEGGMNIIEGREKPEPINFTNTPAEVFNFAKALETQMETISGISSVTRGNPEASLRSGTALAMVQSTSLQYMSGLQQQYSRLMEDVGTGLINLLKAFAHTPRIVMLAGIANKNYIEKEFTSDDLANINRITVEVANPLSQTHAGRLQIASDLMQYGLVKSPEEYMTVLTSGRLDTIIDPVMRHTNLSRSENEKMTLGIPVRAIALDDHALHIKEHQSVIADPDLRDGPVADLVYQHILEHVDLMKNTDPGLLSILGIPSLQQPPMPPEQQVPEGDVTQSQEQGPASQAPMGADGMNLPEPAQVPASFIGSESQQQAQEASQGNVNFNK
jgi:hypothetical protein